MSPSIAQLAAALSGAQGEIGEIFKTKTAQVKTKTGGEYSYSYADLSSVLSVVRPTLGKHGLAFSQGFETAERGLTLTTTLMHSSGEWLSSTLSMPVGDSTPQAYGSVMTYARRYALTALVGVAAEDDDGQAGKGETESEVLSARATPTPRAAPSTHPSPPSPAPQRSNSPKTEAKGALLAEQLEKGRASTLHAELGKLGYSSSQEHYRLAAEILKRPITSLTQLNAEEARQVYQSARAGKHGPSH